MTHKLPIFRAGLRVGAAAVLALTVGAGCATHSHEVRSERVVHSGGSDELGSTQEEHTVVVREEDHDEESRGVLATLVHGVGQVIALPFKLVGSLVEALV